MNLTATAIRSLALPDGKSEAIFFDDDCPGFGLRIRAGGTRVFVFQYAIGGKQRRMTLGRCPPLATARFRHGAPDLVPDSSAR